MDKIDRNLQYCPICRDEYRAEFTFCAACEVKLVSGEMLLKAAANKERKITNTQTISENDPLIKLLSGSLLEMKKLKSLLEKSGIPVLLVKEDDCGGGCCGVQLDLYIRPHDENKASGLLLVEHEKNTGLKDFIPVPVDSVFNAEAPRVICPACGSEFAPTRNVCPDCGLQF